MPTVGSISRETAASWFPFLATRFRGRRRALKEFTHRDPDFVFWIYPDGRLHDAREAHAKNVPRGYEHIVHDEPDYCGFLRGRVASDSEHQLIAVYCRSDALAAPGDALEQFLAGVDEIPVPLEDDTLVVSDNADVYGTLADLRARSATG